MELDTVQKLDNALKLVIMQGMISSVYTNNPEWLIKLLNTAKDNDIDINKPLRDGSGESILILHLSVGLRYLQITEILIKKGAGVNVPNDAGHLPLHLAISAKFTDMALLLIDNGANVDAPHFNGLSPLITAIENNCTDIAIKLIDCGVNIHKNVIKSHRDSNIKIIINALTASIMLENIYVFDKLLDCNTHIRYINENIIHVLDLAIHKKNKYMIEALLQHKNINKLRKKSVRCIICNNATNLSWCSECKIIGYCSITCQKEDWPIHKLYCKNITRRK